MNEETKKELLAELNKLRIQTHYIDDMINQGFMSAGEYWTHKERIIETLDNIDYLLGNTDKPSAKCPEIARMGELIEEFFGSARRYTYDG